MTIPKTNIPQLDRLDWHPKEVQSKRTGKAFKILTAAPNEGFWELRALYKSILDDAEIKISCFNNVWSVNWWQNDEGQYTIPVLPKEEAPEVLQLEPLVNEENVKDFQVPLVQTVVAAMRKYDCTLNGCGTGVGKTFITLAAARELGYKLLVICPKPITVDWTRAAFLMGVELVGAYGWEWIKTGKTPFGHWNPGRKRTDFTWDIPPGVAVVFDEAHRAASMTTQNASIVIQCRDQGHPIFLLSATIANDPTKMRATGYVLGLHNDGDTFYEWMKRNGVKQIEFNIDGTPAKKRTDNYDEDEGSRRRRIKVWKFCGNAADLKRVHSSIFPHKGVRITAAELGGKFPDTQIEAKAYVMDESREIGAAYEEMESAVEEIMSKERDPSARQANVLAEIVKARMKVELLKVPLFVSLTKDYLEEGNSVFMAVNFKDTLRALEDALKIKCLIEGGQNEHERRNALDAFQSNKHKIIAGIIQACREGLNLHDLIGGHPRVSLIMPTPSANDLKQVLGRVHRVGGLTPSIQRIVFAGGTIEENVCRGLSTKLDQLDLLMDGHLTEGIFPDCYSKMRTIEPQR